MDPPTGEPGAAGSKKVSDSSLLEAMAGAWAEERGALVSLLQEGLREQKRERNMRNGFRLFVVLYLLLLLVLSFGGDFSSLTLGDGHTTPHTALVTLHGEIMPGGEGRADVVIEALRDAFEHAGTRAVVLEINSPGGSPVQAGRIYDEILRLRKKHAEIPLYAVLEDLCASGGYYVAAAAQGIYADKATLVGSIGVIMRGFGLEETMRKLGVESRLLTAGENKAFLDPFEPMKEKEKHHAKTLLEGIHRQFVKAVQEGRGHRLKADQETLFNGLIWTGEEAVRLGLVDGLGSTDWVARELVKVAEIVDFTPKPQWWEKFSKEMASSALHWAASRWQGVGLY